MDVTHIQVCADGGSYGDAGTEQMYIDTDGTPYVYYYHFKAMVGYDVRVYLLCDQFTKTPQIEGRIYQTRSKVSSYGLVLYSGYNDFKWKRVFKPINVIRFHRIYNYQLM